MSQKIAFITGGNRGLGFQTALELKNAGAKVVIGSRDPAQGKQAVAKLRAAGVDADLLQFDITKAADAQVAFDYFNSKYGRLDILVNNAGIAGGTFPGTGPEHSAAEVSQELLHKVFETNFFAQVALTEALLPLLKKSPAGRIVNLSSILASLTLQADSKSPIYNAKSFAYDASKTALNAFTRVSFTRWRGSRMVQLVIWPHSRLSVTQLVMNRGPSIARITSNAEISLGGRAST